MIQVCRKCYLPYQLQLSSRVSRSTDLLLIVFTLSETSICADWWLPSDYLTYLSFCLSLLGKTDQSPHLHGQNLLLHSDGYPPYLAQLPKLECQPMLVTEVDCFPSLCSARLNSLLMKNDFAVSGSTFGIQNTMYLLIAYLLSMKGNGWGEEGELFQEGEKAS